MSLSQTTMKRLLAAVVIAITAGSGSAQGITFAGVPWTSTPDTVQARLEAAGWRHVRTWPDGTLRFRGEGDELLHAQMQQGKLVAIWVREPGADPAALQARTRVLADSFNARFGTPVHDRARTWWSRGMTGVVLQTVPADQDGPPAVLLQYVGPGFPQMGMEPGEPDPFPTLPEQWVVVSGRPGIERVALDTAVIQRRPDGSYRASLRVDYVQVVPDPSGAYDQIVYGFDIDCRQQRVMMRSRVVFRAGRQVRADQGVTVWAPARGNTRNGYLREAVCTYVADRL